MEITKKPIQMIFFVLLVGYIGAIIPFVQSCMEMRQKFLANVPEGYNFPMASDFLFVFKVSGVLIIID